jgi:hypothetical protein
MLDDLRYELTAELLHVVWPDIYEGPDGGIAQAFDVEARCVNDLLEALRLDNPPLVGQLQDAVANVQEARIDAEKQQRKATRRIRR